MDHCYSNILVALDIYSAHALKLVEKAARIAKQNQAKLHLVYVSSDVMDRYFIYKDKSLFNFHQGKELEHLEYLYKLSYLSPYPVANVHLYAGNICDRIVELVDEIDIDLVILGKQHKLSNWFGGLEHKLGSALNCDVLQCPHS